MFRSILKRLNSKDSIIGKFLVSTVSTISQTALSMIRCGYNQNQEHLQFFFIKINVEYSKNQQILESKSSTEMRVM